MPRVVLVQKLSDEFDEKMTGAGLQSPQRLLELWSAEKTGSFTVFITRPDGQSCILATGRYWNTVHTPPAGNVAG